MEDSAKHVPGAEAETRPAADRQILLVLTEDDRLVSASLAQAIRHEFPWLDVSAVRSIEEACRPDARAVALILVDLDLFDRYGRVVGGLQRSHPRASVAFLAKGRAVSEPSELLSLPLVRGVLRMNLALDLWLAALRVLMLGGEYFSSEFLLAALREREPGAFDRRERVAAPVAEEGCMLPELTAREMQILDFVARGQQNKLIASALRLSENTVKIHIHHIIAKLGVHNRTEAASLYLASRGSARIRAGEPLPLGGLPA